MASGQVGQHQAATINVPVIGDGLAPATVRATQNDTIESYNEHDDDSTVHFLSGLLTARPAYTAVNAGTKYLTTDSPRVIYVSSASGWVALDYEEASSGQPDQMFYLFATRI